MTQRRRLLFAAVICAIAFLALADAAEDAGDAHRIWGLDRSVQRFVQSEQGPTLGRFMEGASLLGSGRLLVPFALLWTLLIWRRDPRWALFVPFAGGAALILEGATKWSVARPRPNLEGYGFPSGHVLASVVIFGAVVAYLWRQHRSRNWRWGATSVAVFLVIAVAYSRLYLNAHWLTDVLGSIVGGMAYLLFALTWLEALGTPPQSQRSR